MVSKILDNRYLYLDEKHFARGVAGNSRKVNADHPVLEAALFEWYINMETLKILVTGAMLSETAHSLW